MGVRVETMQLRLNIEGKQSLNELSVLELAASDLVSQTADLHKKILDNEKAMKKLGQNSAEYKKLAEANKEYTRQINDNTQQLAKNKQRINELRASQGDALRTTSSLKKEQGELNRQLNNLTVGTEEYIRVMQRRQNVEKELATRKAAQQGSKDSGGGWMDALKGQMPAALTGGVAGALVGTLSSVLDNVLGSIQAKIEKLAERSDAISDLALAFGMTTKEAQSLNNEIEAIDNRLGPETMRKIATEAGKLGVPTEEIKSYTEAVGQATVAMESDFPGGADVLTQDLTKIKGLFADTRAQTYTESIYSVGSAMKALADDGTATADFQVDFLKRMGQLPASIRPGIKELMGLAAVTEEAGMTAEIASSGLGSLLSTAAERSGGFAKLFGMSKKSFEEFLNTDPNGFLLKLAGRLNEMSGTQAAQTLQKLGVSSTEAFKSIGTLGNNLDKVTQKQNAAAAAFNEGTRLTEIFSTKNENLAGKIERAENALARLASNSQILVDLGKLAEGVAELVIMMTKADDEAERLKKQFDDQKRSVDNLQSNIAPLLVRYDQLKGQSKLTKAEQAELKSIIEKVSATIPLAVSEFDKYGRAMALNTKLAREFIETEKARLQVINRDAIEKWKSEVKGVEEDIKNVQAMLARRDSKGMLFREEITSAGTVRRIRLTNDEIRALQKRLADLQQQAKGTKAELDHLSGKDLDKPVAPEEKKSNGLENFDPNDLKVDSEDKAKRLAEEKKKNEQKLLQEIAAMRVAAIENERAKEIAQLKLQFEQEKKEQETLVKEKKLSRETYNKWVAAAEADLSRKVKEVNKKADKELEKQKIEHAERLVQATNRQLSEQLQNQLAAAQAIANNEKGIYDAQVAIITQKEAEEIARLRTQHRKEQEALKDNKEALLNLDKEYEVLITTARERFQVERDQKAAEREKIAYDRARNARKEQLDLDVRAAEQGGNNGAILRAKLNFLDYMQAAELRTANLTETEKTNILRKYQLEREAIIRQSNEAQAEQIAQYFTQGLQAFASLQATLLQNEETRNNDAKEREMSRLEQQRKSGIITEEAYNARREQIDKQYTEKARKLKKKQAEADKRDALFRAGLELSVAIIKTLANPFLLAATILLGGLQIAAIASKEIPEYAEGGRPPLSGQSGQIIRVNENGKQEQITPNWQMVDPATAPMVDFLEYRRANRITGNAGPTLEEFSGSRQQRSAGKSEPKQKVVVVQQRDPELAAAVLSLVRDGVRAYVAYDDLDDSMKDVQSIKNDALFSNPK